MSRLLGQVREAVRTRHYSLRTEEAYLRSVREYILCCGKRRPAAQAHPGTTGGRHDAESEG